MKKNNRGFMLVEILIVVTVIVTSMIFLFVQISNMNNSYDEVFKYDTITSIYAMENIKKFLVNDNAIKKLEDGMVYVDYIDLSNCDTTYITNLSYCTTLFEKLKVEKIYFTSQNVMNLYTKNFGLEMNKYIKQISYDKTNGYRIIVEYKDNTFSSMKLEV